VLPVFGASEWLFCSYLGADNHSYRFSRATDAAKSLQSIAGGPFVSSFEHLNLKRELRGNKLRQHGV